MSDESPDVPAPLSRPLRLGEMRERRQRIVVSADAEERAALARYLGILAVHSLDAELELDVTDDDGREAHLTGTLTASVEQACVVTLEPVPDRISADVDRWYAIDGEVPEDTEIEVEADAADPPDPIVDGIIDPGTAIAELMVLELEPFPRAEGMEFDGYSSDPAAGSGDHPFAALAELKRRRQDGDG